MKFCTTCGNQLAQGQRFCTKCGSPVLTPEPVVAPPIPEPVVQAPTPREYPNVAPIIIALANAGVIDDVLDQPTGLSLESANAWSQDRLAAFIHRAGGSEYRIVIADSALDPAGYSQLGNLGAGSAQAKLGKWLLFASFVNGQSDDSAAVAEKVAALLG